MEFARVLGRRRDVHFYCPWQPVEVEKVQKVLEAARLASRAMNVAFFKAIVVLREQLSRADRDALKTPFARHQFDLAPVVILWYHDMDAGPTDFADRRWPAVPSGAVYDALALPPLLGWSDRYVSEVVLPEVLGPAWSRGRRPGGNADVGVAIGQAVLCAVDQGLGTALAPFSEEAARTLFGVPDGWEAVAAQFLGYPLEDWEGIGQRAGEQPGPKVFEGDARTPFPFDEDHRELLRAAGMLTASDSAPWREEELAYLGRLIDETSGPAPGGGAEEEEH
jgi:hypothetical protein